MNNLTRLLAIVAFLLIASTTAHAAIQGPVYGTLGPGIHYARYQTYTDSYRGTSEYHGFSEGYAKEIIRTRYLRYPGYHPATGFYGANYEAIIYKERRPVLYPGFYRFTYMRY